MAKAEALIAKVYRYAATELSALQEEDRRRLEREEQERSEAFSKARRHLMETLRRWEERGSPSQQS